MNKMATIHDKSCIKNENVNKFTLWAKMLNEKNRQYKKNK